MQIPVGAVDRFYCPCFSPSRVADKIECGFKNFIKEIKKQKQFNRLNHKTTNRTEELKNKNNNT